MRKIVVMACAALLTSQVAYAQKKITGPWIWIIAPAAPGGAAATDVDSLDEASNGRVTEEKILKSPPQEGDKVGQYRWTEGEIAATGGNNVNLMINEIGLSNVPDINNHTIYGWINVESRQKQKGTGRVGSDDSIKIWINGEVVHRHAINRGAQDFQDTFTVELNRGSNPMLVKCSEAGGGWSLFVGIDANNIEFNLDADNLSVDPAGKQATAWGSLKRR